MTAEESPSGVGVPVDDGGEEGTTPSMDDEHTTQPLVRVHNLEKYFWENDSILDRLFGDEPVAVRAVDGISFDIYEGETLGLVGESGCGKSTAGETLLDLQAPTDGNVEFDGKRVQELSNDDRAAFRRAAQIVFQDPFSSLDPRMTIGEIVRQPLDIHDVGTDRERRERVADLLERVGLAADQLDRYPHEFSGGQRQRIGIARALALEPAFLVLDEPTSALDVSVQAQVLNLLADLQADFDLTYLFISHDLSVIRHICDRVAVMYLGEIVEIGPVETIFEAPAHPYTQALLESVPRASTAERERERATLSGDVPSPRNPPSGCRFRTRCPKVIPPATLEGTIDQADYRAIMDLRTRIEQRDISLKAVTSDDSEFELEDGTVPESAVPEFVAVQKRRLLEGDLPPRHDEEVTAALRAVAAGEWDTAQKRLQETYKSVCERQHPSLDGGERENNDTDTHTVACHLHNEPDEQKSENGI